MDPITFIVCLELSSQTKQLFNFKLSGKTFSISVDPVLNQPVNQKREQKLEFLVERIKSERSESIFYVKKSLNLIFE